jgi:cytochrome P450
MEVAAQLKQPPKIKFLDAIVSRSEPFKFLTEAPQRYPGIFTANLPGRKLYVVNHPAIVQHILVHNHAKYAKDEGYKVLALLMGNGLITNDDTVSWRKQRTLMQPPFHRESLRRISEVVTSSTELLLQHWKKQEGQVINFTQSMAWLTIEIVSRALFTSDVSDEHIRMIWKGVNHLNEMGSRMARNPYHIPWKFPMPRYVKARKYIAEMNELIYGIINRRKQQPNPPHDLLQLLLEARYEDTGLGMTDEQIRDEVMTIFVAGHETTVNAISWTWHLLKQHPDAEGKLKDESVKLAAERTPVFEDLHAMDFGRQLMNESMRLYPPVPAIGRRSLEDDAAEGYEIKAERSIVINIAGLHHHPDYWERPFEFRPERFSHFDLKGDNRYIFMPFGAGPRICIGNNFAMMEMQLINAMLSARVEMEAVSTEVKPVPLVTLKPGEGVMVKLKKVRV